MAYIVVGVLGLIGVAVGAGLAVAGQAAGAWISSAVGGLLTAVGVIGFGADQRRQRRSPSTELANREARERLDALKAEERQLVSRV